MADQRKLLPPYDYQVGYRKPPMSGRFQPGKSGNPRGRPKRTPDLEEIVAKLMKRNVTVTEDGISRKIPFIEALALKQSHQALKGDKTSLALVLQLYNQYLAKNVEREQKASTIDVTRLSEKTRDAFRDALLLIKKEVEGDTGEDDEPQESEISRQYSADIKAQMQRLRERNKGKLS